MKSLMTVCASMWMIGLTACQHSTFEPASSVPLIITTAEGKSPTLDLYEARESVPPQADGVVHLGKSYSLGPRVSFETQSVRVLKTREERYEIQADVADRDRFRTWSAGEVGKEVAIMVGAQLLSVATVNQPLGGSMQFSPNGARFSEEEIQPMVEQMRLPNPRQ